MKWVALALAACVFGCVIAGRQRGDTTPLNRRAAFDFQCAENELQRYKLGDTSYGVTGCGKRATYVESCQGQGPNEACTWVLNGPIESTAAQPAPQPAPAADPQPAPAAEPPRPQPAALSN